MAKIDNMSNSNYNYPEGMNRNQAEHIDTSNNYVTSQYKNYFMEKKSSISISDRKTNIQLKSKDKNFMSKRDLKSDINLSSKDKFKNKKENNLTSSSILIYRENKFVSKCKVLYKSKQKYISILLLISGLFLFLLSVFDLMKNVQNREGNYLLFNLIIFILEMVISGLIILFHIIYYFINISNNYITFLIMIILILIFTLLYVSIYIRKKLGFIEIILIMVDNLLLIIINFVYLFKNYSLIKKKNKVQKNIEDIMNFSIRNDKVGDFHGNGSSKDKKIKGVELVEE